MASLSLPPVPVRTVASASTSSSVPLAHWWAPARLSFDSCRSLRRTTPRLRNSSAVPQFTVTCGAGITEINESQFEDTVVKANRPVLVEFVANWCGPCRLISPAMESLAQVSLSPSLFFLFFVFFQIPILDLIWMHCSPIQQFGINKPLLVYWYLVYDITVAENVLPEKLAN